jgi:hypothetical protein
MRPKPAEPETQDSAAFAREAWRRAKAEADRLYWKLCRDRVNARRRARYRNDEAYRERVRARRTRRPAQEPLQNKEAPQEQTCSETTTGTSE